MSTLQASNLKLNTKWNKDPMRYPNGQEFGCSGSFLIKIFKKITCYCSQLLWGDFFSNMEVQVFYLYNEG